MDVKGLPPNFPEFDFFGVEDLREYVSQIKSGPDENCKVLTKGMSPAKALRKFTTSKGHKARKEFWR